MTGITDNGLIKSKTSADGRSPGAASTRAGGEDKVPGVIGAKAIHMTTPAERKIALKLRPALHRYRRARQGRRPDPVHLGDMSLF